MNKQTLALQDFKDSAKIMYYLKADHDKFDEPVCILFSQFLHDSLIEFIFVWASVWNL